MTERQSDCFCDPCPLRVSAVIPPRLRRGGKQRLSPGTLRRPPPIPFPPPASPPPPPPPGFYYKWPQKTQCLRGIKAGRRVWRLKIRWKIKSQGGFQGICSILHKVRCQSRVCVCVCVTERDVWGIQSWPCHAESYFPLAVARQHHLDGEKWSQRDGGRGIKTETGLTPTWYFPITPFCFKVMPLLVPQLTAGRFLFFLLSPHGTGQRSEGSQ